jgi:hypothetical protein
LLQTFQENIFQTYISEYKFIVHLFYPALPASKASVINYRDNINDIANRKNPAYWQAGNTKDDNNFYSDLWESSQSHLDVTMKSEFI